MYVVNWVVISPSRHVDIVNVMDETNTKGMHLILMVIQHMDFQQDGGSKIIEE